MLIIKNLFDQVYESSGLSVSSLVVESESQDYGACSFIVEQQRVIFRVAKVTPKKSGQFVTLWKREGSGPIMPFDRSDSVDLFVVCVCEAKRFGQFVFPKAVLHERGIVSGGVSEGKRAMRVYPPWSRVESRQAERSQSWQCEYYVEIGEDKLLDASRIRELYS